MADEPELVVVSNRGPVSFSFDDAGNPVPRRGAGGLVSSLAPLVRGTSATWMVAAISDADREASGAGLVEAEGFRLRMLSIDETAYRMAYDVISNATLWFLHHAMFDLPRRPTFDRRWREAWGAYREVNLTFARALIDTAPEGAIVLVQDYHLALVGTWLAQERRDLRAVHFTHVPFCDPSALRVLPSEVADELLIGMSSHASCGFHAQRWADNFSDCCQTVLGWRPSTFVSPIAPDADDIGGVAASLECEQEATTLDEALDGKMMILRVDRIEPSKNILRGFQAFDDLLRTHPEWRGKVVFVALIYPSREGLPEYLAYRQEAETLAASVNATWSTPGWIPVLLHMSDNFPRSVAALRRYDVLLVNPVRDGLNLVAKEGALLNENDGVVVLSRESGVWEELGKVALEINPFDVTGTADTLATALLMGPAERAQHAADLRKAAGARTPRRWLDDQVRAAVEDG